MFAFRIVIVVLNFKDGHVIRIIESEAYDEIFLLLKSKLPFRSAHCAKDGHKIPQGCLQNREFCRHQVLWSMVRLNANNAILRW